MKVILKKDYKRTLNHRKLNFNYVYLFARFEAFLCDRLSSAIVNAFHVERKCCRISWPFWLKKRNNYEANYNKTTSHIISSTGPFGCPYDCDYHWYRLDDNGLWSHKPGQTPATDKDGKGQAILDPRDAANGDIPYKFVCFMTIDRNTIKIKWVFRNSINLQL